MSAPAWLRWMIAAVMIAVAGYHLARLTFTHRRVDVELGHATMAAAMGMMLVALPPDRRNLDLALLFTAAAVWFAARSARRYVLDGPGGIGLLVAPAVGSVAMAYLLAAPHHASTMAGMPSSSAPSALLTSLLVVAVAAVAGSTVLRPDFVTGLGPGPAVEHRGLAVEHRGLAVGCALAANLTTVYMLVTM